MKKGLIHLYIGKGKGKTTSVVGLTLRAYGSRKKICFVQFLKPKASPEIKVLRRLKIPVISFKERHPLFSKSTSTEGLKKMIYRDLEKVKAVLKARKYDFIVLDEVLYLLKDRFIKEKDILTLMRLKAADTELVLTGGAASKAIINLADYVSTIRCIKHPLKKGIIARKGIEF